MSTLSIALPSSSPLLGRGLNSSSSLQLSTDSPVSSRFSSRVRVGRPTPDSGTSLNLAQASSTASGRALAAAILANRPAWIQVRGSVAKRTFRSVEPQVHLLCSEVYCELYQRSSLRSYVRIQQGLGQKMVHHSQKDLGDGRHTLLLCLAQWVLRILQFRVWRLVHPLAPRSMRMLPWVRHLWK